MYFFLISLVSLIGLKHEIENFRAVGSNPILSILLQ